MGNSTSRVVGCFVPSINGKDGVNLDFLEPLDEGLGHSFCYVRPVIVDSPAITPSNSERFTLDSSTFDSDRYSGSFRQEIVDDLVGSNSQKHNKNFSETTFKTISGASVSANASTARTGSNASILSSSDAQNPAATFESTASFASIPLQPVPRGSGPLNGFMSGPLERGFTSGPLEKGVMSGPIDCNDRSNFSAPLGYARRKAGLGKLVRSMSRPMRFALTRMFTRHSLGPTWMHRLFVHPMTKFAWNNPKPNELIDVGSSDPEYSNTRNLQWAHGKAGEDRVHVVLSEEQGWLFVGIYDGFSGPDAPDFLMSNLYKAIDKELKGLLWDDDEDKPNAYASVFSQGDDSRCPSNCMEDGNLVSQLNSGEQVSNRVPSGSKDDSTETDKIAGEETDKISSGSKDDSTETDKIAGEEKGNRSNGITDLGTTEITPEITPLSRSRKSKRLYELFQMESVEDSDGNCSILASDFWSGRISLQDLPPTRNAWCSSSITCGVSVCTEEGSSLREQDGVLGEDSKNLKHRYLSSTSAVGNKQLVKHSLLSSKLRTMYKRQKSLRKKFFPWSYDWHRNGSTDERAVNPSVVIRKCKPGPRTTNYEAVLKAMGRALESIEEAYMEMVEKSLDKNPELSLMGSCVLVMLMKDQDVYVINLGDSRVVLAQDRMNERHGNSSNFVRAELDRISEESPMNNINSRVGDMNKNKEISIYRLKMRAVQLSTDHSTSIEEEVQRIKTEHPDDAQAVLNDRVKGQLKVTRAFGAGFLKRPKFNEVLLEIFRIDYIGTSPYLSCTPSVFHHRLSSGDRFLVLSSDGLYQYFSNEEVVSHVAWFMDNMPEGDPAQYLIAELLFRAAKKNGMDFHELLDIPHGDRRKYHDDVSVMVISLEGRIWRSAG